MRVAVVCPYDLGLPGGVQQLTIELVDRLVLAGHEAWLVGPGERVGARSVGGTLRVRANDSVVPLALGPAAFRLVRDAIADADVVHLHEPVMPIVSWAALATVKSRVLTFHAAVPRWVAVGYRTVGHALNRAMRSSILTAVSTTAAAPIPKRWGPVTVIPNAIDVDSYSAAVERSPTRVTFLGRDDRRKGLDVLLGSWPAVRAAVPDAELVVIGTDRETVIPGVVFVGRVDEDEKRSMLAGASIHVAPNLGGESFGIVLAEAMASGAAIVASDLGAFRDVVEDAGVLVPVGDRERLGDAIIRLLDDSDERDRLRVAARRRVEMFDWPQVVGSYLDAYRLALEPAP